MGDNREVRIQILDEMASSLQHKASTVRLDSKYCVYKVPEYTKKGKEEFYKPSLISIGPIFYGDENLNTMLELKLKFLNYFIEQTDNASRGLYPYFKFVSVNEKDIRERYQETTKLLPNEFVNMIVLDAIFLVAYFLLLYKSKNQLPSLGTSKLVKDVLYRNKHFIQRDLFLMENQLPFFVLKGIYDIAFKKPLVSLIDLALLFIKDHVEGGNGMPMPDAITTIIREERIKEAQDIKHLLHLRMECCYSFTKKEQIKEQRSHPWTSLLTKKKQIKEQRCHKIGNARHLSAAGVKFRLNESENLFDITFDKTNGELKIPKFSVRNGTERQCRNMLIFEQFDQESAGCFYFFDYLQFFDQLIDNGEDIQKLQEKGILDIRGGSDEEFANLFNNLVKSLPSAGAGNYYAKVNSDLEEYTSSGWNAFKDNLRMKYFNNAWGFLLLVPALVLFGFGLIQTGTSIYQSIKAK